MISRVSAKARQHKGLLSIAGGSAAGQALAFIFLPVLSRLYTPTDFGALAVVTAYAVTLATFATLRLELAVPVAKSSMDAQRLVFIALASCVGVASAAGITLAIFGERLAATAGHPEYAAWLWSIAPLAVTYGGYVTLAQAAIREERLTSVGARNALQPALTTSMQVVLGLATPSAGALVGAATMGYGFAGMSLLRKRHFRRMRDVANLDALRDTLIRYKQFPTTLLPAGVLNILGLQFPVVLVAWQYGGAAAGAFGMSQRVLGLPVTLVGTAVAQVYLSKLARLLRENDSGARQLFRRASRSLAVAAGVLIVLVAAVSPWAFRTFLGSQWEASGHYAQLMAITMGAQLVAVPISQTLIALGRLRLQLAWDAARLVAITAALIVPASMGLSSGFAVASYSVVSAAMYLAMWLLCAQTARRSAR